MDLFVHMWFRRLFWSIALGRLLEDIHVTWAHLEKKRSRLQLYTKSLEEYAYNAWRQCHILMLTISLNVEEDLKEDPAAEEEKTEEEMDVDDDDEMNEPELIFSYEADPLNPPPLGFDSEGESSSAAYDDDDGDILTPGCMRKDIKSLFRRVQSLSRRRTNRETTHARVKDREKANRRHYAKLDTYLAEDKVDCKKLKRDLEKARLSNTVLCMDKEQVERDLYQMRTWAYEFYQEMVRVIAVQKEGQSEVVDVLTTLGETSPRAVELCRWFEKTEMVFSISECAEGKKVKFVAPTLQGHALTWWNSQVATLGLENVNRTLWTELKKLMNEEFFPKEEI
nr:putative reverse transcriptase domain-containing protein [Tanacetum cinerariifolium]